MNVHRIQGAGVTVKLGPSFINVTEDKDHNMHGEMATRQGDGWAYVKLTTAQILDLIRKEVLDEDQLQLLFSDIEYHSNALSGQIKLPQQSG